MPSLPWDKFVMDVTACYREPMRKPATLRAVRQVLRELGEVGLRRSYDLTPGAIGLWLERHKDRSAARTLALLRALAPVARYAAQFGYLRGNPFDWRGVRQWVRPDAAPSNITPGRRHRSREEIGRVLDLADAESDSGSWAAGRLQCLVYLLAFLGLRLGEALHLAVSDVDLDRGVLRITPKPGWKPKTLASSAELPLHPELAEVLRRWIPRAGCEWLIPGRRLRGPWTGGPRGMKPLEQIRALGVRAGVDGLSALAFRKTIGTQAKAVGIHQLGLKALLRHTSVATQRYYDQEDSEVLRPEVCKIAYPRAARMAR